MDHRHGVEEKFWLAQVEQASLYSDRAHEAWETVKVVNTIPSFLRCANKLFCLIRSLPMMLSKVEAVTERRLTTRAHDPIEVKRPGGLRMAPWAGFRVFFFSL